MIRAASVLLLAALLPACDASRAGPPHAVGTPVESPASPAAAPPPSPVHVDRAVSPQEALRRFREGLPRVGALVGGAESREALVRRWVRAVEGQDTAALRGMVLSPAEYAYLYYPGSSAASRGMRPDVLWLLMQQNSEKGIVRVLRRLGGEPLGYVGHRCPAGPVRRGESRVWEECVLKRQVSGDTIAQRLFGSILERGGRYKLVSYGNEL